MEIEDITQIDLFLRSKNGLQHLLDIDALIVVSNDQDSVTKLRDAAYRLNEITSQTAEPLKQTWQSLFSKQVRYSVNRAKEKK
jgi:hypothetical protein